MIERSHPRNYYFVWPLCCPSTPCALAVNVKWESNSHLVRSCYAPLRLVLSRPSSIAKDKRRLTPSGDNGDQKHQKRAEEMPGGALKPPEAPSWSPLICLLVIWHPDQLRIPTYPPLEVRSRAAQDRGAEQKQKQQQRTGVREKSHSGYGTWMGRTNSCGFGNDSTTNPKQTE